MTPSASRCRAPAPPPAPPWCGHSAPDRRSRCCRRRARVAIAVVAAARHVGRAHADQPHRADRVISRGTRDRALPASPIIGADSTMRSNQRLPWRADAHHHRAAHRMPEREDRRRAIRQHDLLHQRFDVALVFREVADVALARIGQRALGAALPAPVDGGDGKAAGAQFAHRLEIFLDEFGAALEQAHRALAARRRMPARKADAHAVAWS